MEKRYRISVLKLKEKRMTKNMIHNGNWKQGQSGNPKGRPSKQRVLTDILRAKGDMVMEIGGDGKTTKELLAVAVWQFVTTGKVSLAGKTLEAENVIEWASVVKWLYTHLEPPHPNNGNDGEEPEVIVRIVRDGN
jgi:hypothetical protein